MRATFFDSASQRSLERLGYAVVPLLDPDEVDHVTETYWRLGPAPGDSRMTIHFDFQSESTAYKASVAESLRPLLEPKVDTILDRHHLFSTNYIMKWPGERSGFAPHQDTTLVDESKHRSVTIWCPLTDTVGADGTDNGILRFVPGSHEFVRWIRAHDPGAFAFEGMEQQIIDRFGVAVPVRAGEAIVFDHRAVHFSMPNSASEPRLVIAMGLRPQEADLLHYRRCGDDQFDVYGIDDEYYIKMNPFLLRGGVPGYEVVDRITMSRPTVDAAEFERLCRAVGEPTDRRWIDRLLRRKRRVNADPFCFRCGTTELAVEHARTEHGNLQYLCDTCASAAVSSGPAHLR